MSKINKILFITLSNIGDVILTLPALDFVREEFPGAKITVMVGPRPKEIFLNAPFIDKLIVYDKRAGLKEKIKLFSGLKKEKFDMVVDLRNTFLGAYLPARYKTSPFMIIPEKVSHMKDRHLYRAVYCPRRRRVRLWRKLSAISKEPLKKISSLYIGQKDEEHIADILKKNNIGQQDKVAVVAAGARSHIKTWDKDRFAELILSLIKEFKMRVILVGDKDDISINKYITEHCQNQALDLSAKTNIAELSALLNKATLLITNDSALLHLGGYLNIPTIAIFGPTDDLKYGPWSEVKAIVKKDIFCRPCRKAQCRFKTVDCMRLVKVEDVLRQVRKILADSCQLSAVSQKDKFKRILIVRTDRIGDVLLSTPAIKALRDANPNAYIAMMVAPSARDIAEGNPYLDEVLIYDKDGRHKTWIESVRFARILKKKKFDLVLILHPTNRVHLVTFFAGIPRRVGYDRKMGFLLTDRLSHTKQLGEKHELEYTLDIVRYLGIEPKDKDLFMPLSPESEDWADEFFAKEGIREGDRLLAVHPGASCPSKIWPSERFAETADKLADKYRLKIILISGPKDIHPVQGVIKNLRHPAINLSGKTSISQLASVLKRCQLLISNDSGPVHIASGVGTPVISIFGRNQRGLSPRRWGPRGIKDRVLHREVGCRECLAHKCGKGFACLKAITAEEVTLVADSILRS